MQTRPTRSHGIALAAVIVAAACAVDAAAQQVECQGAVKNIAAVTRPAGHDITTPFQGENLQPLLATTIQVENDGCVVASLSE